MPSNEQNNAAAGPERFPDVLAKIGAVVGAEANVPVRVDAEPERGGREQGPLRVLVVTTRAAFRKKITGAALAQGMVCEAAGSAAEMVVILGRAGVVMDAVVVDAGLKGDEAMEAAAVAKRAGTAVLLGISRGLSGETMVRAMRAGVADVVETDVRSKRAGGGFAPEVGERIRALANGSRNQRAQEQRLFALRGMCRRLNDQRREVVRQMDALCSDLLVAYQEMAQHMNQVTTASEFKGLIKGELDIEQLLRTTLEFVLSRSGPTNAAVFLPTTSGDYSLGAYVNYDCPKETCDVLLDHLANVVAPRFERTTGLINLTTPEQLERYIESDADWLEGSNVVGFACRHDREVLAIFMLFRDRNSAFAQGVLDQVKTVGELFAAQLARVIHIHHRHLPKEKWGMLGDPNEGREDDYGDLAA